MTLVVLCVAALALIAAAVSGASAVTLSLLRAHIEGLTAAARARVYFAAALAPMLVAGVLLLAALAPSFGWITDHCHAGDPHVHAHICGHHVAAWPSLFLIAVAALAAVRVGLRAIARMYALVQAARARRTLDASCRRDGETSVLPFDAPQAFVLGLLRPRLYVTEGLVGAAGREHLAAVLAHERAHVLRRDPLRRYVAGLALAFHLPFVARWLDRSIARAQEMAADDIAARVLDSRVRVARALVALSRSTIHLPDGASAFSGSDIRSRVEVLMDDRPRSDRPTPWMFGVATAVVIAGAAASADLVHHGVEILLGLLGS